MSAEMNKGRSEKASGTESLKQKARETASAAKEELETLKESGQGLAREAGEKAKEAAEEQRARAGGQVAQMARALGKAAEELDEGSAQRQIFEKAAEGVDDLAAEIQGRNVGQLIGEVADFGRRHPAAFAGSAALLGFALARFTSAAPVQDAAVEDADREGQEPAAKDRKGPGGEGA